jgi:hypothetical protein
MWVCRGTISGRNPLVASDLNLSGTDVWSLFRDRRNLIGSSSKTGYLRATGRHSTATKSIEYLLKRIRRYKPAWERRPKRSSDQMGCSQALSNS